MRGQMKTGGEYYSVKQLRYSCKTSTTNPRVIQYTPIYASRKGHQGSFDTRSNRLIHVWRNKYNQIMISHSSGTGYPVTPLELDGVDYQAIYTPSVSCGPDTIYYNCIMVWAGAAGPGSGEHCHYLKWMQFRLDQSGSTYNFSFAPAYGNER